MSGGRSISLEKFDKKSNSQIFLRLFLFHQFLFALFYYSSHFLAKSSDLKKEKISNSIYLEMLADFFSNNFSLTLLLTINNWNK